jgi:protein-disulfide isomerase
MSGYPKPIRLPGEPPLPREPYEGRPHAEPPAVVDEDFDQYGAEAAAVDLTKRITQVHASAVRVADDGGALLSPPFDDTRDHIDGPVPAWATLVVFGAYGTPASRPLADVLAHVRDQHPTTVAVAWRHFPNPNAHPHAVVLALAAEAAAVRGRFWTLTRELLRMRHHDPDDLRAAMRRLDLDPGQATEAMRAGTGADRIVEHVASALASGVTYSPALFVNGERYPGELDPAAVSASLDTLSRS